MIAHLTWDTFVKDTGHAKCFFDHYGVELKFTECVSFYRLKKIVSFFLKLDLILKLHVLKPNALFCIIVTIMVTMVNVGKG